MKLKYLDLLAVLFLVGFVSVSHADEVIQVVQEPVPTNQLPFELQALLANPEQKALAGAHWQIYLSSDYQTLHAYFITSIRASGTFLSCPLVPLYTATTFLDGTQTFVHSTNRLGLIFVNNDTCGLHFTITPNTRGYPVAPGQYEFRFEQPAYGAPSVGSIAVPACRTQTPLYQLHTSQYTDYFYTTLTNHRDIAVNTFGYVYQGAPVNVESIPVGGSLPFKRFYKWLPQTDHVYTTSPLEEAWVLANGWVYEGIEGYIYPTQKPGTIPMYRLHRWYPATGDLEHYYTTSTGVRDSMIWQGWRQDLVAGFTCP